MQRAKIIDAQSGFRPRNGSRKPASEIVSKRPEAMQLGCLGTLLNIAGESSSTIVFPADGSGKRARDRTEKD